MLRALFFDAAGTLFDTIEPAGHIYARVAREFGVDAPATAVHAGFRRAFAEMPGLAFGPGLAAARLRRLERGWWEAVVRETFRGLGEFADFEAFFSRLYQVFADPATWRTDPEAPGVLGRLKSRGFGLGVISNFDHRVRRVLEGLGLAGYFNSITISSEAGYAKPDRRIFEVALAAQGIAPACALHVGDSLALDVKGATDAGLYAVLLDRGAPRTSRIEGRVAQVDSLAAVEQAARSFGFS